MPVPRIETLSDPVPPNRRERWWIEWCFFRVCFRHFRWRFLAMGAVLLIGGLCFRVFEESKDLSFLESIYYTFSLIFGEPPEEFPASPVLKALFFIVPILGLTIIIEGIVDFSMILQDRRRSEKSWCTMLANSYHDHIILVGLGRLGFRIFNTLIRLGEKVVVIERDERNQFLEEIRRHGAPLIIGDARREALLDDANVAAAASIILATDDDMANLEAALDARKQNPRVRVVLRMFDQNMADKVREGFNIHLAMSPSALSAPTFATSAIAPATVSSVVLDGQVVSMQRWLVRTDGPLCGRTILDVMAEERLSVVEHVRGASHTICPMPDTTLEPGDGLMLQGPIKRLQALRDRMPAAATA